MEIKHIKDGANLDNMILTFAVRKVNEDGKTTYVSDVEITTADWKKTRLKNVSLRDTLYHFGQAVLSSEDMEYVDKYIYEYNKIYMAGRGTRINPDCPGYLSYHIPRKNIDTEKEFHLHTGDGYRNYKSFDELYKDAKKNATNKTYENAMRDLMFQRQAWDK